MILTIGMIVKNEEKHLRSCLEAITPLLKQVDSEPYHRGYRFYRLYCGNCESFHGSCLSL